MRALLLLAFALAADVGSLEAQATFHDVPWGISRAAIDARMRVLGYIPPGPGETGYVSSVSGGGAFLYFDRDGRLVGVRELFPVSSGDEARQRFMLVRDNLQLRFGSPALVEGLKESWVRLPGGQEALRAYTAEHYRCVSPSQLV